MAIDAPTASYLGANDAGGTGLPRVLAQRGIKGVCFGDECASHLCHVWGYGAYVYVYDKVCGGAIGFFVHVLGNNCRVSLAI